MKEKRSFAIIVIFLALAIVGCALVPKLPVKLMPSRVMPGLTVAFSMPGAASRVLEAEVTGRLEGMLARIEGVKEIKSVSNNGNGHITISFDKHTDMQNVRFEASAIIRQAWSELPEGVSYPTVSVSRTIAESSMPVLSYMINGPGEASGIMDYAEEYIRPAIGRIKGVNRVTLSGAQPMEWLLAYDSERIKALGITTENIKTAIADHCASQLLGMAMTDKGEWIGIQSVIDVRSEFDLSGIYVTASDSTLISLDRVVTVRHEPSRPTGYYRINGLNSIYCNIYADEDSNRIELAKEIKSTLGNLSLPSGYMLCLGSDSTEGISAELEKVYFRTGLTLLVLLLFVALMTLNLRYMLVIAISLVLSLAVSAIFYYILGIEIQLYSLAGITISLNLVVDNIIVLGDHYRRKHDLRAFTSVLAATLTTIGALSAVFFLDDELRLNLVDFVAVVIINLTVSLAASLWLVPALIERIGLGRSERKRRRKRLRLLSKFNRIYACYIRIACRWRWSVIAVAVLSFGIPVFMIPHEWCSEKYNKKIRPRVDKALGGTLRLFAEDVFEGSYFNREDHNPVLQIGATLPNGSTLDQMDELVKKMETFLSGNTSIVRFQTNIYSAQRANISVMFTRDAVKRWYPNELKSEVIGKALTFGGGNWSVFGLDDQGFSNYITERAGNFKVKLKGYNYDELESLAEQFKQKLLSQRRIKEVTVGSEFSYFKEDYKEFHLVIDRDALKGYDISVNELFGALQPVFGKETGCGVVAVSGERIILSSCQSGDWDVWALMNMPFTVGGRTFKLSQFSSIEQVDSPKSVAKDNQEYTLCLQYEYMGDYVQGRKVLENAIEEFQPLLPMGYTVEDPYQNYGWGDTPWSNYWLLLLVVAVISWITSILFNSILKPLVIIAMIPFGFIGLFLAFYFTGMNFDQGGFAAFVLLSGITVNAAIYLMTEYQRTGDYLKAFNAKIVPILLTVLSTVLGFIPFMVGEDSPEPFWFPLALGTIGGLITSMIALVTFLPVVAVRSCDKNAS